MKQEQLRGLISNSSVEITNQYKEISPVVGWSNWVDDETSIVSISNPSWGIIEDEKEVPVSDITASTNRLKTVTVGASTKVNKSLLNKSEKLHDRVVRAFAISSAKAISNIGYFGNPGDTTIPTITSTGTVQTTSNALENIGVLELTKMYKTLDPTSLYGAVFEVNSEVRDNILNAKEQTELITFSANGGRLHVCGIPVYVNEDFKEGTIVAALVNPFDVFTRCTFFEDGIQSLIELSATKNEQEYLSVFDTCSVVDQKNHAIVLKHEVQPVKATTRKAK